MINLPITAAELGSRACGPRQPIKGFVLRSDGSPVSGLVVGRTEELTTVYGGPYRYEYRNWATLFNGSFALPTAGAPVPISMALFPETGCPDFRRVNIPLMILGRVDASGIFTPATDLPQGVSVEASDSENIVVRLPASPPTAPDSLDLHRRHQLVQRLAAHHDLHLDPVERGLDSLRQLLARALEVRTCVDRHDGRVPRLRLR